MNITTCGSVYARANLFINSNLRIIEKILVSSLLNIENQFRFSSIVEMFNKFVLTRLLLPSLMSSKMLTDYNTRVEFSCLLKTYKLNGSYC